MDKGEEFRSCGGLRRNLGRFLNAHFWPCDWPGLKALEVRIAGMEQGRKAVGRDRVKGNGRAEHYRPS